MKRNQTPRLQYNSFGLSATYRPQEALQFLVTDESSNCDMVWNPETGEYLFIGGNFHPAVQERFKIYREAMAEEAKQFIAAKPAKIEAERQAAIECLRKMVARMEAAEAKESGVKWSRSYLKGELFSVVSYLDNSLNEDTREEDYILYYTHNVEVVNG